MANGYCKETQIQNVGSSQTVLSNAEPVGRSYKQFSCLVPEGSAVPGKTSDAGVVRLTI